MHDVTVRKALARRSTVVALAALSCAFAPAIAQAQDEGRPAVARLSLVSGEVTVRRADSQSDVAASLNAPLMVGDYLATQSGSRAELEIDASDTLRLADKTQLRFAQADSSGYVIQVAEGTTELRVFRSATTYPEIDTPSVGVRAEEPGRYRVTVTAEGTSKITVRSGRAQIATAQGTRALESGSTLVARGSADDPQLHDVDALALDAFDQWNDERDRAAERAMAGTNYVADDVQGASDLNQYGRWVDQAGYGNVWVPPVSTNWSPYSNGRWSWEPYYGWTWIDAAPWGWTPFHYGRWFYAAGNGWCWYPGLLSGLPVWQPALVSFIGFGGIGFPFGSIGWVPLAPFEPFVPWWGPGIWSPWGNTTIVHNNITNVYNITHIYRNANAPHAVLGLGRGAFQDGDFDRITPLTRTQLNSATALRGPLPIVPSASDLAFGAQPAARSAEPNPTRFRDFHLQPAAPQRSFKDESQTVELVAQRWYGNARAAGARPDNAVDGVAAPSDPSSVVWSRFGSGLTTHEPTATVRVTVGDAWSRFRDSTVHVSRGHTPTGISHSSGGTVRSSLPAYAVPAAAYGRAFGSTSSSAYGASYGGSGREYAPYGTPSRAYVRYGTPAHEYVHFGAAPVEEARPAGGATVMRSTSGGAAAHSGGSVSSAHAWR